ncbi:hypothetical protein [Colwellia sp. MB3u-55]|jgi:hypothetical protein|uniref:hypothetical protein n=1 Tax=Colwellia sp. MB3u-55 TaxID=2759810 RepID=UPI0015F58F6A|nr:hypothetical protein [Colwellia sp. MB3u-55]MBA6253118.1 hypothetical protein [Colwellia sp. MB3u-55]
MDKETKAKNTTRNVLKSSYAVLETIDKRKEILLGNLPKRKGNLKKQLSLISQELDLISDERLIHKGVCYNNQKTSKHTTTRWVFLDNIDNIKIKHIEEKIFPITEVRVNSKKPFNPQQFSHAIFIERHFLERIVERLGIDNIGLILQTCRSYITALIQNEKACDSMLEDNEIRMLTEDSYAYVRLMTFEGKFKKKYQCDFGYVLSTFLPQNMWSKRISALLAPLLTGIKAVNDNPSNEGYKAVVIFKPSTLKEETKIEIMPDEIETIIS